MHSLKKRETVYFTMMLKVLTVKLLTHVHIFSSVTDYTIAVF